MYLFVKNYNSGGEHKLLSRILDSFVENMLKNITRRFEGELPATYNSSVRSSVETTRAERQASSLGRTAVKNTQKAEERRLLGQERTHPQNIEQAKKIGTSSLHSSETKSVKDNQNPLPRPKGLRPWECDDNYPNQVPRECGHPQHEKQGRRQRAWSQNDVPSPMREKHLAEQNERQVYMAQIINLTAGSKPSSSGIVKNVCDPLRVPVVVLERLNLTSKQSDKASSLGVLLLWQNSNETVMVEHLADGSFTNWTGGSKAPTSEIVANLCDPLRVPVVVMERLNLTPKQAYDKQSGRASSLGVSLPQQISNDPVLQEHLSKGSFNNWTGGSKASSSEIVANLCDSFQVPTVTLDRLDPACIQVYGKQSDKSTSFGVPFLRQNLNEKVMWEKHLAEGNERQAYKDQCINLTGGKKRCNGEVMVNLCDPFRVPVVMLDRLDLASTGQYGKQSDKASSIGGASTSPCTTDENCTGVKKKKVSSKKMERKAASRGNLITRKRTAAANGERRNKIAMELNCMESCRA